jgi:hypothetical protein
LCGAGSSFSSPVNLQEVSCHLGILSLYIANRLEGRAGQAIQLVSQASGILEGTHAAKILLLIVSATFVLVAVFGAAQAQAQDAKSPYPNMAPLGQYLMERNAEIALARSAAPESISRDADVMVLGRHGYETAVKGKNVFVCIVQRSWTAGIDDPNFWNPKLRAAICFNPPSARTYLPNTIKRTELLLAGKSKAQMFRGSSSLSTRRNYRPRNPARCAT